MKKQRPPLTVAGLTLGQRVKVNAKNRNSHGWRGTVDGFSEDVPGVLRVRVLFENERAGGRMLMTFNPTEVVPQ